MVDILDHYMALAEGDSPIHFAAEMVCQPKNLSLIIQLSVEGTCKVQFRAHRILQSILRLNLPVSVLDEAVKIAAYTKPVPHHLGNRSEAIRLLKLEAPVVFEGSSFLQLYFN